MKNLPKGRVWRDGDKIRARVQVGGKRKQLTFTTERAAWQWVDAMREIAAAQVGQATAPPTLLDVGAEWFKAREESGRIRHVAKERSVWRAHVATWNEAHRPIRSLKRQHVHEYVSADRGVSRQTRKHALRLIRQVLAHAHDTGLIRENVADGLRVPREATVVHEKSWTWLAPDEIAAVLKACNGPEQRAIVAVAIYTGARKREIWQLRWSRVRLDGEASVDIRGELKSETSAREIPLLPPAVAALRKWKVAQEEARKADGRPTPIDPLVFPSASDGVRRSDDDAGWSDKRWTYRPVKDGEEGDPEMRVTLGIKSRAGLERRVRFHDLRHSCASHLVQGTWGMQLTLEEVRQWMGHSDISVTQRYAHLSPAGLRAKVAEMRRVMTGTDDQQVAREVAQDDRGHTPKVSE